MPSELAHPAPESSETQHQRDVAQIAAWNPGVTQEQVNQLNLGAALDNLSKLVADPNTPVETLVELAGRFPKEFCENPIFPLLLLENPNLPASMPVATVERILRYEAVPAVFLDWLVAYGSPRVAALARLHIVLAGEAGDNWQAEAAEAIWRAPLATYNELDIRPLNLHKASTAIEIAYDDTIHELCALGAVPAWLLPALVANGDYRVRAMLQQSPGVDQAALKLFRRAGAGEVLRGYSTPNSDLDVETLARLCEGGAYARWLAARHPGLPAALFEKLASDVDKRVRQQVARHAATPSATLAGLAGDSEADVRQQVARNAHTPPVVLASLARDPKRDVRYAVARHPRTPADSLAVLAKDADRIVRQGVTRNPALPQALLAELANDPHPRVRLMAALHPLADPALRLQAIAEAQREKTAPLPLLPEPDIVPASDLLALVDAHIAGEKLAEMANGADPSVRAAIARHAAAPASLLRRLAEDSNPRVRASVAGNPGTPLETLEWLVDDEARMVWRALAENPVTPVPLLERLVKDYTFTNLPVRIAVAHHPHVSAAALARLAEDQSPLVRRLALEHPLLPEAARARILENALLHCLALQTSYLYHLFAYAHPQTPPQALADGVNARDWLARYALCQNPEAPHELLEQLAHDGNRFVRAAARAKLTSSECRVQSDCHPNSELCTLNSELEQWSVA